MPSKNDYIADGYDPADAAKIAAMDEAVEKLEELGLTNPQATGRDIDDPILMTIPDVNGVYIEVHLDETVAW